MATIAPPIPKEVFLTYEPAKANAATMDKVKVNPRQVDLRTDMPIVFKDTNGGKVRIAFLSPMGQETDVVKDSEPCTLTTGGNYQFHCYFTPAGGTEDRDPSGGVLDVIPHR